MQKLRDAFALLSAAVLLGSLILAAILLQERHAHLVNSDRASSGWVEAVAQAARVWAAPLEPPDPLTLNRSLPETVGERILIPLATGQAIDIPSAMAASAERIWASGVASVRAAAGHESSPLMPLSAQLVTRR